MSPRRAAKVRRIRHRNHGRFLDYDACVLPGSADAKVQIRMYFFCVRTTLDLDDELMRAVGRRAADTDRTMTEVLESALREGLRSPSVA